LANCTFPTLNQNTTGSAATLTTGRTIAITGDLTYTSPTFNGSTNVTAAGTLATVNSNVGSFTNASVTVNGKGLVTAVSSGTAPVTAVSGTSPVVSSGGATPAISLSAGYGDTLNPYASKTAKTFLAAPNAAAGVPTFRAIVASDIPTLNQNTTGSAATLTTARTIGGVSFNGSANINLPGVNTAGNQNTSGTAAVSTAATVTTSATASAFKVPFANTTASTTGNYGLLQDSTATFTYNPSTNTLVVGTVSAALSGNATTATTLQTARTIGGVSFNGSANINLPGVNTAGNQNTTGSAASLTTARAINGTNFNGTAAITTANWGTARTIWGQSINGSANITAPLLPAAGSVTAPAFSTSGDTNTGIYFPAADVVGLSTGGTERVQVDASGNVGIGGAPTQKLDVFGGAGAAVSLVRAAAGQNAFFSVAGNGNTFLSTSFDLVQDSANLAAIVQRANAAMAFSTNNTERARIDSSGNLLVGTTASSGKITTFVNASQVGYHQNKPSSGNADHAQYYTDGTLFAKIDNRGSIYNFDNVYGSLSDQTLKDNIVDATPKLADLNRVQVRNFTFKADETQSKQIGVIAQELETVFPSMVDTDVDGIKSVKYSVFVPMLIKAMQEMKAIIDSQAERIAALEAK
jgi:hypothetical protein